MKIVFQFHWICKTTQMWGVGFILVLLLQSMVTIMCEPQVPCYFIFGDSISDVGNNNGLNTLAKANYPPYGVDFPTRRPTGRFSNGRNLVDCLTELLGFDDYIPPYTTAELQQILKGVNYASGAAGIRSETGQHLGERISMDQQLRNHVITVGKMATMLWFSLPEYLGKCLYTVNMGSNDYLNNYFMPQKYSSSHKYSPQNYADVLVRQFGRQLKKLYATGARKVAVFGLGYLGCTLGEISIHGTNGSLCVDKINVAANHFNDRLITLIDQLNTKLPGARFTYIGQGSSDTGPLVANATCCNVREDFQCQESSPICQDRNTYVFFDGFHTTELVNIASAEQAYHANIKTLVSSDELPLPKEITQELSFFI